MFTVWLGKTVPLLSEQNTYMILQPRQVPPAPAFQSDRLLLVSTTPAITSYPTACENHNADIPLFPPPYPEISVTPIKTPGTWKTVTVWQRASFAFSETQSRWSHMTCVRLRVCSYSNSIRVSTSSARWSSLGVIITSAHSITFLLYPFRPVRGKKAIRITRKFFSVGEIESIGWRILQ